jgi:serine phosphatase RsbU (regulator of sigma subunit)
MWEVSPVFGCTDRPGRVMIVGMAPEGGGRRGLFLRPAALLALLLSLVGTVVLVIATHEIVSDQEDRLLGGRAAEVNLVLSTAIDGLGTGLGAQGDILRVTDGSVRAYTRSAEDSVQLSSDTGQGQVAFAWLRKTDAGYTVLAAAGSLLQRGEVITDPDRVRTFDTAMGTDKMVATPLMGDDRRLGFALGQPAAPAGTVLYREAVLGPLAPPRAAGTAPFSELDVALYGVPRVDPSEALTATTRDLPLQGRVRNLPLEAGATEWLTSVSARKPLVGSVADRAWWIALIAGIAGSVLVAAVIETVARRRDDALALYASEHEAAEALQRRLLPQLPTITGLGLAARYQAGGHGQQVGGDWFDAFPIAGGRVGIAIGDVIGHDLTAASAMAQIRAALRAYAVDGAEPRDVVNRLDRLVNALGLTQLVTVVYGLLEPPAADGSRVFRYTNAGHLEPLLRLPGGEVEALEEGASILIGAPLEINHGQGEQLLPLGSTLLLFTDGLVEVPSRPLEETMREVVGTLAAHPDDDSLDALCERMLATTSGRQLRDDIAMLAVRIGDGGPAVGQQAGAAELVR